MGSAPLLAQTPAPWANTGGPGQLDPGLDRIPTKRTPTPWIVLGVLAVLGVGGGVVFKMTQKNPSELVVTPPPLVAPAAPAVEAKPETRPDEVAKPAPTPLAESAPLGTTAAGSAPAAAVRRPVAGPGFKRPAGPTPVAASPAAAPPPAPAPPPPAAPASTGRKIRTEL